jgi:hypothetical protein
MTQRQVNRRTWPTRKPFPVIRVVKNTEFSVMPQDEIESACIIPDTVGVVMPRRRWEGDRATYSGRVMGNV